MQTFDCRLRILKLGKFEISVTYHEDLEWYDETMGDEPVTRVVSKHKDVVVKLGSRGLWRHRMKHMNYLDEVFAALMQCQEV